MTPERHLEGARGGCSPAYRGLRGGRGHPGSRWDPVGTRGHGGGTGREPQTGGTGSGGTRGLGAVSPPPRSTYHVAFGSVLSRWPLLAGGSRRPRWPRVPLVPHVPFHTLPRAGGVTLEQGGDTENVPQELCLCSPCPGTAGSAPPPRFVPKRPPRPPRGYSRGVRAPLGLRGLPLHPVHPGGGQNPTGQTLPGAGGGTALPAPSTQLSPPWPPKSGAYLFSHGARLAPAARHPLGALKQEHGVYPRSGTPNSPPGPPRATLTSAPLGPCGPRGPGAPGGPCGEHTGGVRLQSGGGM